MSPAWACGEELGGGARSWSTEMGMDPHPCQWSGEWQVGGRLLGGVRPEAVQRGWATPPK